MIMFNILVVEDDNNSRRLTADVLEENGYVAVTACNGEKALEIMDNKHIDLVIADIMMPVMDGYAFTKMLRENGISIPIIMVTAKESISDKKQAFTIGADDYMVKPVDEEELLLRVSVLLRRSQIANERRITVGGTTFSYDELTVSVNGSTSELPPKEFMLVYKLLSYPNKIFTRRQLIDEIWDMSSNSDERTVDVHINRLRERFKGNGDFEIVTVRGLGYKAVKKHE